MAGYSVLFKVKLWKDDSPTEAVKIDMNMFKSIWGLMLGI